MTIITGNILELCNLWYDEPIGICCTRSDHLIPIPHKNDYSFRIVRAE